MTNSPTANVERWLITDQSAPAPPTQHRERCYKYVVRSILTLFVALCFTAVAVCGFRVRSRAGKWNWVGATFEYGGFWIGVTVFLFAGVFTLLSVLKGSRSRMTDLATTLDDLEIWWISALALVCSIINFAAGVGLYATTHDGIFYSLGNLIVSAGATVLVAYTGWFTFNLTNGFRVCQRLLIHQLKHPGAPPEVPMGDRSPQAHAVWKRLQDLDSDPSGIFLTALTTEAGMGFARDFQLVLSNAGVVTLLLDRPLHTGNYVLQVQLQFQALMREAKVPPHPFFRGADSYLRVLEHLMQYRKLVVIVRDMDIVARPHGPDKAQEAVRTGAADLKSAGFLFVSIIDPTSLPPRETDNSIQVTPPNDLQINLPPKYAAETPQNRIAMQRAIRGISIALQPTRLRIKTVWRDGDTVDDINEQRDALKGLGLIRFGSDLLREALGQAEPAGVREVLMDRFIERLVVSGKDIVAVADLYDDLPELNRLNVAAVLHSLTNTQPGTRTRAGLLEYTDSPTAQRSLSFQDPRLAEIAIGRWLADHAEPYAFSERRTALCTSAEIYRRIEKALVEDTRAAPRSLRSTPVWPRNVRAQTPAAPARNVANAWADAMAMLAASAKPPGALGPTALFAACGALNAISPPDHGDEFDASAALNEVWEASDLTSRRTFVERLTETAACRIADWLWGKANQKLGSQLQRHIVDRTICRKLGTSGAVSWNGRSVWDQLHDKWPKQLNIPPGTAAPPSDMLALNWETKAAHLNDALNAHSIALLGWLLPSLTVSARKTADGPAAEATLKQLHSLIATPQWPITSPKLDVGVQIALAEGCRDACYHYLVTREADDPMPPSVTIIAKSLICGETRANSQPSTQSATASASQPGATTASSPVNQPPTASAWYSWLVSLQALFVAAAAASDERGTTNAATAAGPLQAVQDLQDACTRCGQLYHPIVKEYAEILDANVLHANGRSVTSIATPHATVGKYTWLDDNKAVSQAGGALDPQVVQILAKSVLLLNHSGASDVLDITAPPPPTSFKPGQARLTGLIRTDLPHCFKHVDAAKKANQSCSAPCQFKLCRAGIFDTPVRRELSRTFLQRCLSERDRGRKPSDDALVQLLTKSAAAHGKLHAEIAALLTNPLPMGTSQIRLPRDSWILVRDSADGQTTQRLLINIHPDHVKPLEEALQHRFAVARPAGW